MKHPEADLQIAIVQYMRLAYPHIVMHSIPNEQLFRGSGAPIAGKRLNDMGRMSGVADLFIAHPSPSYGFHGMYIEVKAKGKGPTEKQAEFAERVKAVGYDWYLSRDLADTIAHIRKYLAAITLAN